MKKQIIIILSGFILSVPPAAADMVGASDAAQTIQLTKIYAVLKTKYDTLVKTLKEAKAQSQFLQGVVDNARMLKKEYDFVQNFSMENVIDMARSDVEGLTYLDDLDGKSTVDRFNLVLADIDRRFDTPSKKDQAMRRKLKGRVKELQRLQTLLRAKLDEADNLTSTDANIRSIHAANATTNCLLLSLEAQRQQREIIADMQKKSDMLEREGKLDDFSNALKKMGKGAGAVE